MPREIEAVKARLREALGIDRDDLIVRCKIVSLDDVASAVLAELNGLRVELVE